MYTPLRKVLKFAIVVVLFKFDLMRLFYGLLKPGVKNEQKSYLDLQNQKPWCFIVIKQIIWSLEYVKIASIDTPAHYTHDLFLCVLFRGEDV